MAAYDYLEKLNIPFRRADHAPAMTMEDCEAIDAVLACGCARICSFAIGKRLTSICF
jgi:Ala-tRNA(Pro) deacylase